MRLEDVDVTGKIRDRSGDTEDPLGTATACTLELGELDHATLHGAAQVTSRPKRPAGEAAIQTPGRPSRGDLARGCDPRRDVIGALGLRAADKGEGRDARHRDPQIDPVA